MLHEIAAMKASALAAIANAPDPAALGAVLADVLGKRGRLQEILRGIGKLPSSERGAVGQAANEAKNSIQAAAADREAGMLATREADLGATEWVDATLPGTTPRRGDASTRSAR